MALFEDLQADWLSFDDALAHLLARATPTAAERVVAWDALGRYLARPVVARATLPSWPNSAMDGFAVRGEDLPPGTEIPVRLPVAGASYPGDAPRQDVAQGAAVRIMTGGALPHGFDTVIRVEHTDGEATPGWVRIDRLDDRGKHVRAAGRDMETGEATVPAGTVVHSGSLPVIQASGGKHIDVHRRPRVGVLSSGDELVGVDQFERVIEGRAVPDTNRAMIAAAISEIGATPVVLGVLTDNAEAVVRQLGDLNHLDALVTTGGASVGERDILKRSLIELSFRLGFWRVRMRPGSPVSFGQLPRSGPDLPVFGLPGNPASAFVAFHVLVAPYLRARLGSPSPLGTWIVASTESQLTAPAGLTQFYRVRLRGEPPGQMEDPASESRVRCSVTGPQGSGLVRSLRDADGLAVLPLGTTRIGEGQPVQVLLLPNRA